MSLPALLFGFVVVALPAAAAPDQAPQTGPERSTIGYATVADAMAALKAKPGVRFRDEKGWTVVDDRTPGFADVWSFTPKGYPVHPAVVKRSVSEKDGVMSIEMDVLCEAEQELCDALVREFAALTQRANDARQLAPGAHPRNAEAENFSTRWLDLIEGGDAKASFALLEPSYQAEQSPKGWKRALAENRAALGPLQQRTLRRIVWYQDPAKAPLPGTYAAVEFDSAYANTRSHFQSILLHSLLGEPFRVMRVDSAIVLKDKP